MMTFLNGTRHFYGTLAEISKEVLRIRDGRLTAAFWLEAGGGLLRLGGQGRGGLRISDDGVLRWLRRNDEELRRRKLGLCAWRGELGELRGSERKDVGVVEIRPGVEKDGFGRDLDVEGRGGFRGDVVVQLVSFVLGRLPVVDGFLVGVLLGLLAMGSDARWTRQRAQQTQELRTQEGSKDCRVVGSSAQSILK